jgi:hypothetical protein
VVKLTDSLYPAVYDGIIHQVTNISEGDKMRQLNDEELNQKIASFMSARLAEHPEIERTKKPQVSFGEKVVSGVQKLGSRLSMHVPTNRTMYQV